MKIKFSLFLFLFISNCLFTPLNAKKAIVIGASSGMGREIAKLLSKEGYEVGLMARRRTLLESLQKELTGISYIQELDVTAANAREILQNFIATMGKVDLILISISAYLDNRNSIGCVEGLQKPTWNEKKRTIDVDLVGFLTLADVAFEFFENQKHGHFVGISSTAGLRANSLRPYQAAKTCISQYMEGARNYFAAKNLPIKVTDIVPGWVAVEHSPLGQDPDAYWEISCEQAGRDILAGIKAQKNIVYVPGRVQLIAWILKLMPDFLYNRYFHWL